MTTRALAVALLAGGLMLAGCAGPTPASDAPAGLRDALPAPGEPLADGLVAFTGADDTGRVGVALVQADDGEVVAYLCDGDRVWAWFGGTADGGTVELTGDAGTFEVSLDGGTETGTAVVHGTRVGFELEPATATTGLFRDVEGDVELGWVVTNDGLVTGTGVGKDGFAVVGDGAVEQDDVVGGTGGGETAAPPEEVDPVLFRKFRCGRLFLRLSEAQRRVELGLSTQDFEQYLDDEERFEQLDCTDFYPDPTPNPE